MKFSSQTLRTFTTLHTWVGLVAGFGLFVAFYAGALTLFHHDLPLWQTPGAATALPAGLDDAQYLLEDVLATHPEARRHVGMTFPGADHPQPLAYWQVDDGSWRYAWPGQIGGSPTPPQTGLAELVNELHYSLGLPVAGIYVMGIVSLLYGMALLSGLVIHLPKLLGDLFALRPGRNLKQLWQDAHNVIGVLSLPFHLMFAVTGALLCLVFVQMALLNPLIFDGKALQAVPTAMDTAPVREATGIPSPPGSLRVLPGDTPLRAHDHVDISLDNGRLLRFNDPRRFGSLLWQPAGEVHPLLQGLGPEPLDDAFDGDYLFDRSRGRSAPVKTFLMDQAVVVGVGNIYAAESLFKAGISPLREAGKVSRERYQRLADAVKEILGYAITRGGTTLRDFISPDGAPGYFEQELLVYGRDGLPCPNCGRALKHATIGQRASVWCSHCQR
ncbi:bifunctional DNA-formamidopyrimidine glycosylase/DNA-(apurinic or apyrimidinic site) lyase [Stenotrophomonas geniculata]